MRNYKIPCKSEKILKFLSMTKKRSSEIFADEKKFLWGKTQTEKFNLQNFSWEPKNVSDSNHERGKTPHHEFLPTPLTELMFSYSLEGVSLEPNWMGAMAGFDPTHWICHRVQAPQVHPHRFINHRLSKQTGDPLDINLIMAFDALCKTAVINYNNYPEVEGPCCGGWCWVSPELLKELSELKALLTSWPDAPGVKRGNNKLIMEKCKCINTEKEWKGWVGWMNGELYSLIDVNKSFKNWRN